MSGEGLSADDVLDLDCGIAYARIAAWLETELRVPYVEGAWLFTSDGCACRVQIEPLESRPLGSVKLERTRLRASGDPEALARFGRLFTLRFVSAGG